MSASLACPVWPRKHTKNSENSLNEFVGFFSYVSDICIHQRKAIVHPQVGVLVISPDKCLVACGLGREVSGACCPSPNQPEPVPQLLWGKVANLQLQVPALGATESLHSYASSKRPVLPAWGPGSVPPKCLTPALLNLACVKSPGRSQNTDSWASSQTQMLQVRVEPRNLHF